MTEWDFRDESVVDLAARLGRGEVSSVEAVSNALGRIDRYDAELNTFVARDDDRALADARAVDERRAAGEDVGPLGGMPVGIKDLEDALGFVTTHGSALEADGPTCAEDSLLTARLRAAGAVVVGKTNTPEYGYRPDTVNPTFGATRNPWDLERTPGGSSGGTAAAVAAGLVPFGTGSDGGGSIRIPAAACALTGHKPSLGRIPTGAECPGWLDLSVRGPMARDIADVAWLLDLVVGPDPRDSRSLPAKSGSWYEAVRAAEPPRRVGWSPTLGYGHPDDEIRAVCESAVETLASLGTEVVEIDRVFSVDPLEAWLPVATVANERSMGDHRESAVWDQVDPGLVAQLDLFAESRAVDFVRALDKGHLLGVELGALWEDVDLLLTPTIAGQLPRSGEQGTVNGVAELNWVQFTYPFNVTRSPAGSVTAGFTAAGLPVGLQVVGPQHDDVGVLAALAVIESALDLDRTAPYAR